MEKDPSARPASYDEALERIAKALEAADEPVSPPMVSGRKASGDALVLSQLAAARAALNMGRTARARDMFDRLYRDRGTAWTEAGLDLAALLERSSDFAAARAVLEPISTEAPDANVRALALWTLGTLAEKESDASLQRAIETYARVIDLSGTLFPKTLLDARIDKLRSRIRGGRA